MNIKPLLCLFAVAALATACAKTDKTKTQKEDLTKTVKTEQKKNAGLTYACLVGKDLRLVEIEKTKKRCEVHYTKYGEKSQVAWAEATPDICSRVKKQIRSNIETAGYKCDSDIANLKKERKTASN